VLTFPVNQGKTLNIVAFHTTPDSWAHYPRLTRQGTRDEALRDFAGYGPNVINLLKLTDEELSVVSLSPFTPTVLHKLGNADRSLVGNLRPGRTSSIHIL
jgi:hypothetical protein